MYLKSHSRIDTYLPNEIISLRWSLHLSAVSCSFPILLSQVFDQTNIHNWYCSIIILIFWLFFCSQTSILFILLSFQRHFIEKSCTNICASNVSVSVFVKHASKNRLSQPKIAVNYTGLLVARNVNTVSAHNLKAFCSSIASKFGLWKCF